MALGYGYRMPGNDMGSVRGGSHATESDIHLCLLWFNITLENASAVALGRNSPGSSS